MAIGNSDGPNRLNVDINVTPLIDVLLVLLIIFMVIVPVTPHGLDVQVPQRSENPNQNPEPPIVVQILHVHGGQVTYKINQVDATINDLGDRLNAIFSLRADRIMFIKGDNDLDFSTVAQVVDIGKGAGADHIGLITAGDGRNSLNGSQ